MAGSISGSRGFQPREILKNQVVLVQIFCILRVKYRVVAKRFVCRLAEKLSQLKKAQSAFCRRRGGRYGRGSPPPIGDMGDPPQEILTILIQFGVLW